MKALSAVVACRPVRLAHLTDIHVGAPSDYDEGDAVWRARAAKHSEALLVAALRDIAAHRPTHVVLTGDLTLTAERAQFERARAYVDEHLRGLRVSVLPGNHDVWSEAAVRGGWFGRSFGDLAACDLGGGGFPYCHLVGDDLAILALDTSPYEPGADPSRVKGRVTDAQLARLEALAADPRLDGRVQVLILHHHLRLSEEDAAALDPKDPTPLEDAAALEAALSRLPVHVVLHGHRHKQMRLELSLGGRRVTVLCPGSATRLHEKADRTGRWSLYELDGGALVSVSTRAWDPALGAFR